MKVRMPYLKVATYSRIRIPHCELNPEIRAWFQSQGIHYSYEFLIGMNKNPENWGIVFDISDENQALLFKLTFGGR